MRSPDASRSAAGGRHRLLPSPAIEADSYTCAACGGALDGPRFRGADRLHGLVGSFDVARCRRCGAGTTLPPLDDVELSALYPSDYGPYDDRMSAPLRAVSWAIRRSQGLASWHAMPLNALRELVPGRGLDVGCGRGDLAALLMRRGWRMAGVEPSPAACEAARLRGVDARCGTLATVQLEPDAYDAIVFKHSLEHTSDPRRDLGAVARALAPGGLLLITVPNFGCWQAKRLGARWYHLDLPRHRTHFTRQALVAALESAGLDLVSASTSTSAVGLPASLQYLWLGRCVFPGGIGLRVASGLAALTQPIARAINAIFGGGDELQVLARRPIASSTSAATDSAGPG